jgi:hypothetical protein
MRPPGPSRIAVAADWPELVISAFIVHSLYLVAHLVDAVRCDGRRQAARRAGICSCGTAGDRGHATLVGVNVDGDDVAVHTLRVDVGHLICADLDLGV